VCGQSLQSDDVVVVAAAAAAALARLRAVASVALAWRFGLLVLWV
jgi:hypothetical protein